MLSCHDCDLGELWILSDNRSVLQHLIGWSSAKDETNVSILLKLRKISQTHNGYYHMDIITDNYIADKFIKEVSENETATGTPLAYQEQYSNARSKLNFMLRIPPMHPWYTGTSPGFLLEIKCERGSQTALVSVAI
ncbi:hypothetical protein TNCV_149401 [Trichonephila clavipes]|nr:hypothetical protein TNCV_149401 [Trichonephila clavipes]